MYIIETTRTGTKSTEYRCVLLRRSYREGDKVKTRPIANLSHCTPQEIEALRLALRYKDDLAVLGSVSTALELQEGPSVGAVCTIYHVARQLPVFSANNPPAHARERGRKSLPGAGLRAGEGG